MSTAELPTGREFLPILPVVIPPWRGSHPFSSGVAVRSYRPDELKKRAVNKRDRTLFFERVLYGIWVHIDGPVPVMFKTADGSPRALDAGCIGFLVNCEPPQVKLITDEAGFVSSIEPVGAFVDTYRDRAIELAQLVASGASSPVIERLPYDALERVTADHIWRAIQTLSAGNVLHPFGESTEYDVICDGGVRLPPKAIFGLAAREALQIDVQPAHFVGGLGTLCFRAIESAGFEIVRKGEVISTDPTVSENQWFEGSRELVTHFRAERARGLSAAKKAEFRRQHGNLFCELCGFIPARRYRAEVADASIEVHHSAIAVSAMPEDHPTRLEDLMCLCANCHRIVHRELVVHLIAHVIT